MTTNEIGMTEPEIQAFIAEKCPHSFYKNASGVYWWLEGGCVRTETVTNSLNAIQAAVFEQNEVFQTEFNNNLYRSLGNRLWHQLTAIDWAICFVKTWKELNK